jgi:hypothetical protein
MPKRSKITGFPEDIRAALNRRLIEKSFADYDDVTTWLNDQGYEISRSAVHRYGQAFEDRLAAIKIATEQARSISEAVKDDDGAMNDALISLVQEKAFDILVNLQTSDPEKFAKIFPKLGIMISKVSNAAVEHKKWRAETRAKAKQTAEEVVKVVKAGGMSEATAKEIRSRILGIV